MHIGFDSYYCEPVFQALQPSKFPRKTTAVRVPSPRRQEALPLKIIQGRCWVVDGDTISIGDVRIRLAGIDAPELDDPWGKQAKWAMVKLCKGHVVTAHIKSLKFPMTASLPTAICRTDVTCRQNLFRWALLLDWAKFSGGKYRHLEAEDARRKLWRTSKETNRDFIRQIEQYRNSLIIYAYESELVKQKLDTVVSQAEIESYYKSQNFHLRENIVLASYVIISKDSPANHKNKVPDGEHTRS